MTPPLLALAEAPQIADTSLEAWRDRVRPTLTKREVLVYRELFAYLTATGEQDVTGGELTKWMVWRGTARDVNGVRPRLTGLCAAGWVEKQPTRTCDAYGTPAHPYRPVVPLAALHDLNPDDGGR